MDDHKKREPSGAYKVVRLIAAVILALFIVQAGSQWYTCQRLSPVERAFTRGC